MNDYKEFLLKDLIKINNGKDYKHLSEGEVPLYGSGGLMGYVNESFDSKEAILLPRKGTLDNIMFVEGPFWTVDTMYWAEVIHEDVNAYYLYSYLKTLDLNSLKSGSTLPSMTFDAYYDLRIKLPNLKIQSSISSLIRKYDSKITLNKNIIWQLEMLSKLIYDYWFNQFDFPNENGHPYKSSGGEMEYNKELKREIPKGWSVGNFYDVADFENGLACQRYRPDNEDDNYLPVVKISEMRDGITTKTEKVRTDIPQKNIINNGDILFSWSASLLVTIWNNGKAGLNQHIFKVTPKSYYSKEYVTFQLKSYIKTFETIAASRKTTMGHITKDHLEQSRIVLPPKSVIDLFYDKVNNHMKLSNNLQIENRKLEDQRDFLIPLLMIGQINLDI